MVYEDSKDTRRPLLIADEDAGALIAPAESSRVGVWCLGSLLVLSLLANVGEWRSSRPVLGAASDSTPLGCYSGSMQALKRVDLACPHYAFDSGMWSRKNNMVSISSVETYLEAAGFQGCSGEGYYFGIGGVDWPALTDRLSYQWEPKCDIASLSTRAKLQTLIDHGGVLLVGDSLTYQHFYSLGCELFPHVRWAGDGTDAAARDGKGREQTQHLYLDDSSNLWSTLNRPKSFEAAVQPLVTLHFRPLPLSNNELRVLANVNASLVPERYSQEGKDYLIPMSRMLDTFANRTLGYGTMLVSFGAHFSPGAAFPDAGPLDLQMLMRASAKEFFRKVKGHLLPGQHILVRAAPPGGAAGLSPVPEMAATGDVYNYRVMPELNTVLWQEMQLLEDNRFQWMGGERIARTRPDAHIPADLMHYLLGAGVLETWSRYMWHLIARLK